jgi:nicotinate phosphoribosyltransferase
MTRTDPSVFNIPVEKMRAGYYADQYFNLTKELLEANDKNPNVVMQVFQRNESTLGGIDEAIAILKLCSGRAAFADRDDYILEYPHEVDCAVASPYGPMFWEMGWDDLTVKALHEGDEIEPWEPVLQIEGPYSLFAHLETTYLGVMARRTLVMNNVKEAIAAANGKPLWFFPARHDHWVVQTGDGMAAHQAGVQGVSTDAGASWWGGRGMGTIPHALIAAYGGDTVAAAQAFAAKYADEMNVTVLVDFDNDSVTTATAVANALGDKLWGVRLDTSGNLVDKILTEERYTPEYGSFPPTGVNPVLVRKVRKHLDAMGHENVKIIVSGGFKAAKIREFEKLGVPVDAYGVGSSLIRGSNDFTADIV